jgi:hypothetical protein
MTAPHDPNEMSKALFLNLIMMFSSSAMQQMGKLVDPATGKTEIHLEGAQMSIDILDMLRGKTQGNLDSAEKALLDRTISTLQMTYVETAREQPAAAAPAEAAPETQSEPPPAGEATPPAGGKDPMYHKSYG